MVGAAVSSWGLPSPLDDLGRNGSCALVLLQMLGLAEFGFKCPGDVKREPGVVA